MCSDNNLDGFVLPFFMAEVDRALRLELAAPAAALFRHWRPDRLLKHVHLAAIIALSLVKVGGVTSAACDMRNAHALWCWCHTHCPEYNGQPYHASTYVKCSVLIFVSQIFT